MILKKKIEALRQIQELHDRSMHIVSNDVELTDAEAESMYNEGLIEVGPQPTEIEGRRFAIVSILPPGMKLLMAKNLHVPRFYAETPPSTLFGRIVSVLANRLWDVAMVLLGAVAGWILKSYAE